MKLVFLDSTPLSILSDPRNSPVVMDITSWLVSLVRSGDVVYLPESIDYELRREMVRSKQVDSLKILDRLKNTCEYLPINTDAMLLACDFWAQLRNSGLSTGDPKKIDIDMIMCAQAVTEMRRLKLSSSDIVVATSNISHISRLVPAETWENILPSQII
jgi:predicted nucleic acid-binding protein